MYKGTGQSTSHLGRAIDVVSTRNMIPQNDSFIEGPQESEGSSFPSSKADTRMPEQFVKINVFKHLESFSAGGGCLKLNDSDAYSSTSGWQMVVQVDEYFWITSKTICDLCFVFLEKDVASGLFDDCRGMYNFFVVKCRFAQNDICASTVPPDSCPPFPGNMEGFAKYWCSDQSKILYNNIRQIRNDMQRILCCVAQSQGDFATRTARMQLPSCIWFYIKHFMDRQSLKVTTGLKNTQPQAILSWGLGYRAVRQTSHLEVLRFDSHSKMLSFRKLFGDTCGFGVRKKRPRFSDGKLTLCTNDVINAVYFLLVLLAMMHFRIQLNK
jgi:hypothetical protein